MNSDSLCEPTVPPGSASAPGVPVPAPGGPPAPDAGTRQAALLASRAAPHVFAAEIGRVMKDSRVRSEVAGVAGAIVSDGERFAQLLEATDQAIDDWLAALRRDMRHADVRVVWRGDVEHHAFGGQWVVGWTSADAFDALGALDAPDAPDAGPPPDVVGRFIGIVGRSDSW